MTATIRYMGSKRSLAPAIASLISRTHPHATVADAFAGTCAIGTALASRHRILANDVHAFAELVARTLLVTPGPRPSVRQATRTLRPFYDANMAMLMPCLAERMTEEHASLEALRVFDDWVPFHQFTTEDLTAPVPRLLPGVPGLEHYRANRASMPYALFSMYFASAYFGVQQAAEVDSLRFAIDNAPEGQRDFYLLALLQAVSHCGATSGHFAQPLIPRDATNTRYIGRIRGRSIYQRFLNALSSLTRPRSRHLGNAAFRMDATDFVAQLPELAGGGAVVVYADPPYSKAQYSRYYHVLETLVLYDYPAATGKGRYRDGRFETDFSRSARVQDEMGRFIGNVAAAGSPLYLSYPQNGLLHERGEDLLQVLSEHYPHASVATTMPLAHSTMGGGPGTPAIDVIENVYYGRWE